jgi:hypothetical protein
VNPRSENPSRAYNRAQLFEGNSPSYFSRIQPNNGFNITVFSEETRKKQKIGSGPLRFITTAHSGRHYTV